MQNIFTILILTFSLTGFAQPGNLDASFGTDGIVQTYYGDNSGRGYEVLVQPDGYILTAVTATFTHPQMILARYKPNGDPDTSFGINGTVILPSGGLFDVATNIALQPDGKIILAGHAVYAGSTTNDDLVLMRFLTNGAPDLSFGNSGRFTHIINTSSDRIQDITLQPDGKIVVAGHSNSPISPFNVSMIVTRYQTNGFPDSSFGYDGVVQGSITGYNIVPAKLAIQTDGKIIIAGIGGPMTGDSNQIFLARLNPDGTPDITLGINGLFFTDIGNLLSVHGLVLQPDGKIVVGSTSHNSAGFYLSMLRYHMDGTPDSTFGLNGVANVTPGIMAIGMDLKMQDDGKMLVCGFGSDMVGDPSKIMVGRYFANSQIDSSFGINGIVFTGLSGPIAGNSLALQPDGKIVALGNNGWDSGVVMVRYLNDFGPASLEITSGLLQNAVVFPNPSQGKPVLSFKLKEAMPVTLRLYNMQGKLISVAMDPKLLSVGTHSLFVPMDNMLPPGNYILQLQAGQTVQSMMLTKE